MATNFDFDDSFNDDPDDEAAVEEMEAEEAAEESSGGRSRLRTIILLLLIIILACVACVVLPPRLGFNSPLAGLFGSSDQANPPPVAETTEPAPATDEATTDVATTGGESGDEAMSDEATSDEATSDETTSDEATSDEATSDEATSDEATSDEATSDEATSDEATSDETTSDETTSDETTSDETTSDETTSDETTTEPTVVATVESCDNNQDPTAMFTVDPDPAMMGKGQAIVTLDGRASSDDGAIVEYGWDFGDGSDPEIGTAASVTHGYKAEGSYIVTLTVLDDCAATASTTAEVTIVGPTPPADNDNGDDEATATPEGTSEPADNVTLGSCYKVQPGDTLTGIAWYFGVTLPDLARVNNVTTEYFVLAGQGLFIPAGTIQPGANGYQVQSGDTLNSIAFQCGITVTHLAQVNGLSYDAALTAGQVIIVPIGYR